MANYYIGWDVGAWKCSRGKDDSCDAIVIMDDDRIVGHYRDNLSDSLRQFSESPADDRCEAFIKNWLSRCDYGDETLTFSPNHQYYIAIDTPLGWPKHFRVLLEPKLPGDWSYRHQDPNLCNSLLYRYTERAKLGSGLSVVVDSIGSQSVKALLLLQLLGAKESGWGIWKAGNITLIETYPKACLMRPGFVSWISGLKLDRDLTATFRVRLTKKPDTYGSKTVIAEDLFDAGICACVAKAFAEGHPKLVSPVPMDPIAFRSEGWIFYPDQSESVASQKVADGHKSTTCGTGIRTFHEAILAFQKRIANSDRA